MKRKLSRNFKKQLAARIDEAVRRSGMTNRELARRIGITPSVVGGYRHGRTLPGLETLPALARELHVSVDWLLTGKGRSPYYAQDLQRLEQIIRDAAQELALDPTERKLLQIVRTKLGDLKDDLVYYLEVVPVATLRLIIEAERSRWQAAEEEQPPKGVERGEESGVRRKLYSPPDGG